LCQIFGAYFAVQIIFNVIFLIRCENFSSYFTIFHLFALIISSSSLPQLLTLHFDRCAKYYGSTGGGQASQYGASSDEEKRLTMLLFSNIFDSLSNMDYDPELFGKALPCLIAIGCALPPDYSLSKNSDDDLYGKPTGSPDQHHYIPQPIDTSRIQLSNDLNNIVQKFSEHYHDAWARHRLEQGWIYGEVRSDMNKTHPRLKPYNMLNDYVIKPFTLINLQMINFSPISGEGTLQGAGARKLEGSLGPQLGC
jgi:hypothetical protein